MDSVTLLWVIFWITFVVVCAADYIVVARRKDGISIRSALGWTILWVAVALGFSAAIYVLHPHGPKIFVEYISGYLTEYSLSVDNLFVFILIFSLLGVPHSAQPKLIKLGIFLSIFLRILFIFFGIALLHRFHVVIYFFGALLLWTGWKMLTSHGEHDVKPQDNFLYRLTARALPVDNSDPQTSRLFVKREHRWYITPLFLAFVVIGSTDVLFAIDSIPAIMGISQDPFVVLTSNVFAVLGLNALFFAVRGVIGLFKFLKHGVSAILVFIGAKMIAGAYPPVDIWFSNRNYVSLLVILVVLVVSIAASVVHDRWLQRPRE